MQTATQSTKNEAHLVISNEVLASIAATAARDIDGVRALTPHPDMSRLLRQNGDLRYVRVLRNQPEIALELAIRVKSGSKIAQLAAEVQRAVKNAVQNMTGKAVSRINLRIVGVDFMPPAEG